MTKRRLLHAPADPGAHPSPTQSLRETLESKTHTHTFPPIDKGSQGHTHTPQQGPQMKTRATEGGPTGPKPHPQGGQRRDRHSTRRGGGGGRGSPKGGGIKERVRGGTEGVCCALRGCAAGVGGVTRMGGQGGGGRGVGASGWRRGGVLGVGG